MAKSNESGTILLREYVSGIDGTDKLPMDSLNPVLMGLYGEVGGIMSAVKKHLREKDAYPRYRKAAEEEFGDTLWYFTTLCMRLGVCLDALFGEIVNGEGYRKSCAASDLMSGPISQVIVPSRDAGPDDALFRLGRSASAMLGIERFDDATKKLLEDFARSYIDALHVSNLAFSNVVHKNLEKTRGRFLPADFGLLETFDSGFEDEEKIPPSFRIKISQRKSGRSFLSWNGVFIGDALTDNIKDRDGYRFHDVFHLAYAAILNWSPVFRALIKHKRKSVAEFDEEEDSGRAIVVEEGLTAWLFTRAKDLDYFSGHKTISFDVLKIVQEFVTGYEVSSCPLSLWEKAILDGYAVFRQIRDAGGGWVVGNREARTIIFEPLEKAL